MTATDDTPAAGSSTARRVLDVVVTVLAVAGSLLSSFFVFGADVIEPSEHLNVPGWYAAVGFVAAIGAAVALCWRHHAPVLVTGVAVVPPLVFLSESLAALIALAALAAARRDRVLWLAAGGVFTATALAVWRDAQRDPDVSMVQAAFDARELANYVEVPLVAVLLIAAVLTAIPLVVGMLRGARRDLSRGQRKEQELRAEMARQDERTRIAREMHDVLGHRLSQLSLQAGALEVAQDGETERTAEAARTVRGTTRAALDDLRQVIGVLRDGRGFTSAAEVDQRPERPQPTLGDIPELIESARRSGLEVVATVLLDDAGTAPVQLGTAAYRIVQESVTNVLRHAPHTTADVAVRGGPGHGVTIEVSNPLPEDGSAADTGSGTGLTGIAERVAQLDGTVSTGPTGAGRFAVATWLPWPKPE